MLRNVYLFSENRGIDGHKKVIKLFKVAFCAFRCGVEQWQLVGLITQRS